MPTIRAGEAAIGVVPAEIADAASVGFNLINGKFTATASSNALTVAIKTRAGNDPSPLDPVYVGFRDEAGDASLLTITAALSLTISAGSTLATFDDFPFRLWLLGLNNGGTLALGLIKCTDINRWAIYPINENQLLSTTAEGGAGGADSAGIVYSAAALTSKQFRILGYLEWSAGLATAGNWTAPDIIRLHGIGMPKPGDVVQETKISTANISLSATTTIPNDNSVPQSGEGSAIATWDLTIRATSLANVLDYHAELSVSNHTGSLHMVGAVFLDAEAGARLANAVKINAADDLASLLLGTRFFPEDLSSHTYKIRIGGSSAGTWTINGVNGGAWFGSILPSSAQIRELMT